MESHTWGEGKSDNHRFDLAVVETHVTEEDKQLVLISMPPPAQKVSDSRRRWWPNAEDTAAVNVGHEGPDLVLDIDRLCFGVNTFRLGTGWYLWELRMHVIGSSVVLEC